MQYLNQLLHLPPPAPWSDRPKASAPGLRTWQDVCCFCRPQWPPPKKKYDALWDLWIYVAGFFAFGDEWYEFGSIGLYFNLQFWSWRIQGCVKETSSWRLEIPHNYFHTSPLESITREPLAWRHVFTPPKKQLTGFCTQFTRKHIHAHCCTFYTYKSYKTYWYSCNWWDVKHQWENIKNNALNG